MFKSLVRKFLASAVGIFLYGYVASPALAQSVEAAERTEPYRVFAVVWRGETEVEDGFREYFTQRGIPFEMTVRNLNLDRGNAPAFVEEIKQAQPDLVYTWGTGTTTSVLGRHDSENPEKFVQGIPGIFVLVAYPKVARIVESYENTGRNLTGVSFLATIESQINTILAYRQFKKVGIIYDKTSGNSRINVASLEEILPKFGLDFVILPVPLDENEKPDPKHLPELIHKAKDNGADILYMGPDSFLVRHGDAYTSTANEIGLPTFSATQAPLKNSRAMFGLVTDYHTLGKLAAVQAEKILVNGKKPEELPVARLSRFKLWINIDVAREVGLYPPMEMISIADFKTTAQN